MKKRTMKISLLLSLSLAISSSQAQFSAQAIREAAPRSAAIAACVAGGSLAAFSVLHGAMTLRRFSSPKQMHKARASLLRRNFYRLALPALVLSSTGAFYLLRK